MNIVNKLSLSRIAMTLIIVITFLCILFFNNDFFRPLMFLIILISFLVGVFTDFLDGYLARKKNLITNFGKFIDPIADKVLINTNFIIIIIYSALNKQIYGDYNIWLWLLVSLLIIRDIIVDGLRNIASINQVVIPASFFGKIKTIWQMITITSFLIVFMITPIVNWLMVIAFIGLIITTAISLWSGFKYYQVVKKFIKE